MTNDPYAAKPWLKQYDEGVPEHIDYPEINLYEILDNAAKYCAWRNMVTYILDKRGHQSLFSLTFLKYSLQYISDLQVVQRRNISLFSRIRISDSLCFGGKKFCEEV